MGLLTRRRRRLSPLNNDRANKINDQITIMKSILEGVGLRPPCTKSSILSEGIALVRHLLATADQERLAALKATSNANNGMLGPGGEGGGGDEEGGGSLMDTTGLDAVPGVGGGGGHHSGAVGGLGIALVPYVMLFRKSATPLAMAEPDGAYRFLDWCVAVCGCGGVAVGDMCYRGRGSHHEPTNQLNHQQQHHHPTRNPLNSNLRFAEVFKIAPEELQEAALFAFTRKADADNTRRVLSLVNQPGGALGMDESTPLEVVLTNPQGQRFLVRVSALTDDACKPRYLLFTPKAVLRGAGPDEAAAQAATVAAHGNGPVHGQGHGSESGNDNGTSNGTSSGNGHHHPVKPEEGAAAAPSPVRPPHGYTNGHAAQAAGPVNSAGTSSEGSSMGSANSSSNSLCGNSKGPPRGLPTSLAGTTEAAMAAARTLPSHIKPL